MMAPHVGLERRVLAALEATPPRIPVLLGEYAAMLKSEYDPAGTYRTTGFKMGEGMHMGGMSGGGNGKSKNHLLVAITALAVIAAILYFVLT